MDGQDDIYQGGDGTALRFFYEPVKNNFQTEKHGRPIFDTSLYVEVLTPGSTESMPKFELERVYCPEANANPDGTPATERMIERTPRYFQYEQQVNAFRTKSGEFLTSGTPLSQWPVVDVGTAASLKASGISTVEMLAAVSDGNLLNLGTGGRVLRDQAQAYLQTQTFGVPTAKMAAESANLREDNISLQSQVNDLTTRLNAALSEVQTLRSGQPPAQPSPGGPATPLLDPLSTTTISQPNTFATLDSNSASPLTPTEGEAADGAKAASQATLTQSAQPTQPPAPTPLI